jgi:apolipoprotein D and lipocalin family protein
MNRHCIRLCILLTLGLSSACTTMKSPALPPLKTVSHLDLNRYMGDWFVYSHIPYALEKGKVGTLDRYALRPDGKIDNIFLFRKGSLDAPLQAWNGVAWVHDHSTNAEWRVQFLWPLRVTYLIIDLDPDYQWSVIGYPNRKLAWVLSRKPTLDDATYQGILTRLKEQGYDPSLLAKVPQRLDGSGAAD